MSERSSETDKNGNAIVESVLPGETATARAAHASLKGDRKGLARLWPFLGPFSYSADTPFRIWCLGVKKER